MSLLNLRSLRNRLLFVTLLTAGLTVVASGLALSALFRDHVRQQFVERLTADLDQVLARLEVDSQGQPTLDAARLSDPRWTRPHSGLYWQVDAAGPDGKPGLLRSRSLWDEDLVAPRDTPSPGELHVHDVLNHRQEPLLVIEQGLHADGAVSPWRVMVAASTQPLEQAAERFDNVLIGALLVLMLLLCAGALLQVTLGLAPLGRLRAALSALRDGRTQRLEGRYPTEVQPLADDLNSVLDRQAATLDRARTQAGNLAHALKTPLTILGQGAANASGSFVARDELPALVLDQVQVARRHIDWHLARARAAAAQDAGGLKTPLQPVADGLVRVMQKVYANRRLSIRVDVDARLAFAGESQDLQEMLGNLLDNACKAARTQVLVSAMQTGPILRVTVDDDGQGIAPDQIAKALQRGRRLDETTPGSGLGLAIVQELATMYEGTVELGVSPLGGLLARLNLPAG
ncbi:sensor histidine kinase [Roseateles cellulosilyticus]|uniref:histidine kinase n=1 Tax=Pelomonas cellulosilytica TaxID=2906762 RepID=A0ABS8Y211_9BURK|nr:sensor histidine kinase [Pelomonas sp. P8]MCE4557718.1 sensor histidine kinase [Pelomonas sp. P8]